MHLFLKVEIVYEPFSFKNVIILKFCFLNLNKHLKSYTEY